MNILADNISKDFWNNKVLLLTGGTGTLSKNITKKILQTNIKKIILYSRDEFKQVNMKKEFNYDPRLKFIIGNVRDYDRLLKATKDVDYLIHAAALKHVPVAEDNPMQAIMTNIIGSNNVIQASIENKLERVMGVSTDKAVSPLNLYGSTKLCMEKLFQQAQLESSYTKLGLVRYGNVWGSRGSVVPFFMKQKELGYLTVTDKEMTRFNITIEQAVNFVLNSFQMMNGGELFVPKLPAYNIVKLAETIGVDCEIREVGIRPGEKIHESMMNKYESKLGLDCGTFYLIVPRFKLLETYQTVYSEKLEMTVNTLPQFFEYSSDITTFLNGEELTQLIN